MIKVVTFMDFLSTILWVWCRRGGPLSGPEGWLLPNTQKWIVQRPSCWQSKSIYWKRGALAESKRVREPRRTVLPRGTVSGFAVMVMVAGLSLASHSDSGFFRGEQHQSGWILARRILGGWQDIWTGISSLLLTFSEFFWLEAASLFQVLPVG